MLEILGENAFRIRAYRRAADVLKGYALDLAELVKENPDELDKIPGIGKGLQFNIEEFVKTGNMEIHKDLLGKLRPGILDVLKVRGVGPKKAKLFWEQLDIDTVEKLRAAAESGALATLAGMGEKSEQAILESLSQQTFLQKRIPLYIALPEAEAYVAYMKKLKEVKMVTYGGSTRRRLETIGDLDIVACGKDSQKMSEHFLKYPKIKQVLSNGETKSSVVIEGNLQVDFRVVDEKSWGSALYYFTGSKQHHIQTRTIALRKNLKINEYGVFKGEKNIASKSEEDIFKAIGLKYIPPEIREDNGEIEAAMNDKLPKLIEESDLRGDLHTHTKFSDGANSVYDMAVKAEELGMEYIGICDHGRDPVKISDETKEISSVRKKLEKEGRKIKIIHGAEIDILKNGVLNLPEEVIAKLDLILISVHTAFNLPRAEQTERILSAMRNPKVNILCHPTARLIGERDAIEVDMEEIIKEAKRLKIAMEINSQPRRMDMNGGFARLCKNAGVKVSINSDAHDLSQLETHKFGLFMARRGWIEKSDVINALPYEKLIKFLKK